MHTFMADQTLPQPQRPQPVSASTLSVSHADSFANLGSSPLSIPTAPAPQSSTTPSLSLTPEKKPEAELGSKPDSDTATSNPTTFVVTPSSASIQAQAIPSGASVHSVGAPVSKLMQNLQSVSSQPFKDPNAVQFASTQVTATASTENTVGGSPFLSASAIPQEPVSAQRSSLDSVAGRKIASPPGGMSLARLFQKKILLVGGAVFGTIVLAVGAWAFFGQSSQSVNINPSVSNPTSRQVTLNYWGLWEPESVMAPIIAKYEAENPGVKINYVQQNSRQYRQRLQAAIRDGSGPDIYRFHNTWVPMLREDLSPAPASVFSTSVLQQDFYPNMSKDLVSGTQVLGVPLMYEGLALLYNRNMLQAANALPPTDWQQVRELALRLTLRNGQRIERGGIALGTTGNVDHFSDILGLMMLQNSADLSNPVSMNAQSALEFYTIFSRVDQVWDTTLPPSTQAFASEQVAMIFAPSWRIHEIQELNPNLNIGVTRLPQIDGTQVTWASYWAEGVSSTSRNKEEAWKFIAYLSQPEQLRAMHSSAGSLRGYGELYPRVSMASELRTNPLLSPYVDDALYGQSWYMSSATFDEGLNDGVIQYYADAVNAMNQSGDALRSLEAALPGIQQVLSRYGVVTPVVSQ
jgi:multiple sugar transport system substrate-binding protein